MDLRDQLQTTLGPAFSIERELGGGGMSRVFVAEDAALGRKVVVKVLAPELGGGVNLDRFQREIGLAARLQHPHIVPLLSAGEVGGLPYFTMPYVEGESLRARVAHGELPVGEAVAILRDVAKALDYAHSKGVVHRDIKPDNVLLTGGSAAVTDFGVAKALAQSTQGGATLTAMGVALGTPAYMAPEQAAADPATDHRADIYALGATAYEMLAGHPPFAGRPAQQMLAAHATEIPLALGRLRPALPPALSALVMSCLEKRAADRPQTAREVLQALEAVTTPAATAANTRRSTTRGRWIAAGVMGALLVVAVATTTAIRSMRTPALNSRRVVVAPFENLTGDTSLALVGRMTADWISQGVGQLDSIEAVPSSEVFSAVADAKSRSATGVRQLARGLRAGTVVSGSIYRIRDSLRFQAQVVDVTTGKVLRSVENVVGPASDPLVGIRALRERIMGGIATFDVAPGQVIGTTPRYEAYEEFLRAVERFNYGEYRTAIPLLEHAIALDSTFAMAYLMLATAHSNRGEWAVADSIVRITVRRRADLPRTDRAMLDWHIANIKGDHEETYRIAHGLMERDSSWVAMWLTGYHGTLIGRPREAVRVLARATPPRGWWTYWSEFARAYHELGDYENELRVATQGNDKYPGQLVTAQLEALGARGDAARVGAILDSVVRAATDTTGTPAHMMLAAALELRAHGHDRDASAVLARARQWLAPRPRQDLADHRALRQLVADVLFADRQFDSAQARYAELAATDSMDFVSRARVASAAAFRGDTATAHRIDDVLSHANPPYSFGVVQFGRAEIAAALGQKEAAVRLLTQALAAGSRRMPEIHRVEEFQALRGYEPFEAILRPKG